VPRTIPQVAKDLGVSDQTLRNWVSQADVAGKREDLTTEERSELRELRRETASCARSGRS
jgi:transposase